MMSNSLAYAHVFFSRKTVFPGIAGPTSPDNVVFFVASLGCHRVDGGEYGAGGSGEGATVIYNYTTKNGSAIYHILKEGRIYTLCGQLVKRGKNFSIEPPAWKKECVKCTKVLREQTDKASAPKAEAAMGKAAE